MKKIFYVIAVFAAVSFASCGNNNSKSDTIQDTIDTVSIDTVVADSVITDSVTK